MKVRSEWESTTKEHEKTEKTRSISADDLRKWRQNEGIDAFRLMMINGIDENEVKFTLREQRKVAREMALKFRNWFMQV